jgi:hypothetical protein
MLEAIRGDTSSVVVTVPHVWANATLGQHVAVLDGLVRGESYSFRIRAISALGASPYSRFANVTVQQPGSAASSGSSSSNLSVGAVVGILIAILVLLLILVLVAIRLRHKPPQALAGISTTLVGRKQRQTKNTFATLRGSIARIFEESFPSLTVESRPSAFDALERDWTAVTQGKELGKGAFGIIKLAHITDALSNSDVVALHVLDEDSDANDFLSMFACARALSCFRHDHIVRLIAVNTLELPYFVALEYVAEVCGPLP